MKRAAMTAMLTLALCGAAQAQGGSEALTRDDVQAIREATQATAKATRESLDYIRVTPDMLHQILAKLDKIENKLDKLEDLQRAANQRASRR